MSDLTTEERLDRIERAVVELIKNLNNFAPVKDSQGEGGPLISLRNDVEGVGVK